MLKKIKIGDLLVSHKFVTEEQLKKALQYQQDKGGKLGHALLSLSYIDETTLLEFLARQQNIPFIELLYYRVKPEMIQLLPETLARRFRVIVLDKLLDTYLVGMADPTDLAAVDEVSRHLKTGVRLAVVREHDLLHVIDDVYRRTGEIKSFASALEEEIVAEQTVSVVETATVDAADAPVVKLLNTMFEDAVQMKASDIHIEPDESVLRIRQRIDGVLSEQVIKEKNIAAALVSRLKLMAKLNISEKRLPQDGRFRVTAKGHPVDIRLSTMPVQYGESVVMRLLDPEQGLLSLDQIGMEDKVLKKFRSHVRQPNGLVLVTGPTGSGKTTTLYAALNELNTETKKIISIEDPIEYTLMRINQVQVNPKIGLDFARVLRTALRQDPDIVMVGEMRDVETAKIGMRASMTGHLVLSTLHTNDAISSALRLIDMGAEGYMVASALRMVLAQRLVRRLCEHCAEACTLTEEMHQWVSHAWSGDVAQVTFQEGRGCARCANTGYKGRIGIYELLEITPALATALRDNDPQAFSDTAKADPNFQTLFDSGMDLAVQGLTSVAEVFRVAGE